VVGAFPKKTDKMHRSLRSIGLLCCLWGIFKNRHLSNAIGRIRDESLMNLGGRAKVDSANLKKSFGRLRPLIPGDQEGLFKLVVQLRKFFNSVIYNTATGYVLLVYLTNI
jgi:hypothetical protein